MPLVDKELRKAYHREYYRNRLHTDEAFRKDHRERVRKTKAKTTKANKELVATFRSHGCLLCPEATPCCLTAHHVRPEDKGFNIGDAGSLGYSTQKVKEELQKCVCLCFNCHAKYHAGVVSLPDKTQSVFV
jgi:hypothetical protein